MQYNDTSKAWKTLNNNVNHEALCAKQSIPSKDPLSKQTSNASTVEEIECESIDPISVYCADREVQMISLCELLETNPPMLFILSQLDVNG